MAVVWGVVKDLKGFIDVQSMLGAGTTFKIYLPASRQASPKQAVPTHLDALRGQRQSVLVVDDDEVQRQIACQILQKLGYAATVLILERRNLSTTWGQGQTTGYWFSFVAHQHAVFTNILTHRHHFDIFTCVKKASSYLYWSFSIFSLMKRPAQSTWSVSGVAWK